MRLLIFIHSLSSGGAERVTVNLANYWSGKGWDVTIVTMMGEEEDFYTVHSGVRRITLNADMESRNPVMAVFNNIFRLYALRKLLKHVDPDIALAMMSTANILLALANLGLGVKVIGSERTYPPKSPIGRIWNLLRRITYPFLSAVVAQTNESAEWLSLQLKLHRVFIVPNPVIYPLTVHKPCVKPEQVLGNMHGCSLLLAVGRLGPEKGFERLITAFKTLSHEFPDWCLVILGEGFCLIELEEKIVDFNLEKKVYLPGGVGNVADWYEKSDLYVMTSLFEGFPNTLVEAMAYSLPAVSVDCETGPRDIIRHEVDGLLVPQNDNEALVEALAKLMSDERLREIYSNRASEVRDRFSIDKVAGMWEKVFTDIRKR